MAVAVVGDFRTISSTLGKSCEDTQRQETVVLAEEVEMNLKMAALCDTLDEQRGLVLDALQQ